MKKVFLPIFILTWTLVLTGLWIIQPSNSTSSVLEYIFVGVIFLFFLLGGYLGYGRIKRKKQGLPEEDELSIKIAQKSAAISFYLSLVLWLALIFIQSHFTIDIKWLLSSGMIGMAIIFVISWLIINNQGIDEK
jgi:peptidoglycan/LPS O-acetylase OafA/YrhL